MVNAVLSAEDKHFFQHAGFDPIGIVRAIVDRYQGPPRHARRVDADAATGAHVVAGSGARMAPQDSRNADHAASGAEAHQAADFRRLRQRDLSGPSGQLQHPRLRRSGRGLPRQGSDASHSGRCGTAGRADSVARSGAIRSAIRIARATRRNVVLKAMRENGYLTRAAVSRTPPRRR